MSKELEVRKVGGFKRVTNKIIQTISMSSLISGKYRERFQKWVA